MEVGPEHFPYHKAWRIANRASRPAPGRAVPGDVAPTQPIRLDALGPLLEIRGFGENRIGACGVDPG